MQVGERTEQEGNHAAKLCRQIKDGAGLYFGFCGMFRVCLQGKDVVYGNGY